MPLISKQQPPYYTAETNVKQYIALITQSGTNPPTAQILKNTYPGTPQFTYSAPGNYNLTLTGAFPIDNTTIITGNTQGGEIAAGCNDENSIYIVTRDSAGGDTNDLLLQTTIQITTYP